MNIPDWLQYSTQGDGPTEFFGVTQSAGHTPNENRIAFRASSIAEVDEIAQVLREIGARTSRVLAMKTPEDYAVFFEDPAGNRLEVCYRSKN